MQCTHCGSLKYVKNGGYRGVKRYKFKSCFLYFSAKVRKFSYKDKERESIQMGMVCIKAHFRIWEYQICFLLRMANPRHI